MIKGISMDETQIKTLLGELTDRFNSLRGYL